jgi:hypothetical protein
MSWVIAEGMAVRATILSAIAVFFAGCGTSSNFLTSAQRMELHTDEAAMRAEVLQHVQPGMPVEEAKRTMERHGFKCSYGQDDWLRFWEKDEWLRFWEGDDPAAQYCLICSRFVPYPFLQSLFISDEIKVFVLFEEGKVKGVIVRHVPCCV